MVELDAADQRLFRSRFLGPSRSAEDRSHASHELPRAERLREVVVGTDGQSDEHIRFVVASGEHEHGNRSLTLDLPAHLETVEAWQHEVEDDEGRSELATPSDARGPVCLDLCNEALASKARCHRACNRRFILDHEDHRACRSHIAHGTEQMSRAPARLVQILCRSA